MSDEVAAAATVMAAVREAVRAGIRIDLPRRLGAGEPTGFVPNAFGGVLGPFCYQLEGEDDLLHLIVARRDGDPLTAEEGRLVASELFKGVSSGLVWLRPGTRSQHFYVGHDDLLNS
ncbi:MAG: hypothetical protein ACYC96_06160 [Fimbriimonadaceae bacterium]